VVTHLSLPKWTDDTVGGEDGRSVALGVAAWVLATMGRLSAVAQVVPAARATPTTATTVRHDRPGVSRRPSPEPAPTEVSLTVWSMSSIEHPVPVETPLQWEARVTSTAHPRYLVIEATVQCAGKQLARSTSKIFRQESPTGAL